MEFIPSTPLGAHSILKDHSKTLPFQFRGWASFCIGGYQRFEHRELILSGTRPAGAVSLARTEVLRGSLKPSRVASDDANSPTTEV